MGEAIVKWINPSIENDINFICPTQEAKMIFGEIIQFYMEIIFYNLNLEFVCSFYGCLKFQGLKCKRQGLGGEETVHGGRSVRNRENSGGWV